MKTLNENEKNIIDILIDYQSFKLSALKSTLLSSIPSSCSNTNARKLLHETIIREYDKLSENSKYSEYELLNAIIKKSVEILSEISELGCPKLTKTIEHILPEGQFDEDVVILLLSVIAKHKINTDKVLDFVDSVKKMNRYEQDICEIYIKKLANKC